MGSGILSNFAFGGAGRPPVSTRATRAQCSGSSNATSFHGSPLPSLIIGTLAMRVTSNCLRNRAITVGGGCPGTRSKALLRRPSGTLRKMLPAPSKQRGTSSRGSLNGHMSRSPPKRRKMMSRALLFPDTCASSHSLCNCTIASTPSRSRPSGARTGDKNCQASTTSYWT